ncbi:MAG: response regulator [Pseudomonadales bacterium]|nr:response regulator [Pseudomonadales bacterium]
MLNIGINMDDLASFVGLVPVPCLVIIPKSRRIITANKEAELLLGGDSLGAVDCYAEGSYLDESADWHLPLYEPYFDDGKVHSWHSRIKQQDGIVLEIHITAQPVMIEGEQIIVINLRDRSQEAQEHRYSNLLLGTLSHTTHHDFFEYFARSLARIINMDFVAVCRSVEVNNSPTIDSQTIAFIRQEKISPNFTYSTLGMPCEKVLGGETVIVPIQAKENYPALGSIGLGDAQIYLGMPLVDSDGEILGQIWAMDNSALHDFNQIIETMRSYAPLVASELRRRMTEEDSEQMQMRLTQAQKLESLGVLAGGIAHDFNNLLTGILGNAELGLEKISAGSDAQENLTVIRQSAVRAADLCRQMLTYAGQGLQKNLPLAINSLVTEMLQLLQVSISHQAELVLDLAENLPMVAGDASQISQIIMNLITNASEALNAGNGIIRLKTRFIYCDKDYLSQSLIADQLNPGSYVFLEISDSGMGMNSETVERMFDPFYTTKFAGRGLGLSAVLGIVRGHGGTLRVTTEVGEGTSMSVLFPASTISVVETRRNLAVLPDALVGRTIVIADDDATVLATIAAILRSAGATVITANDGHEVVSLVRQIYAEVAAHIDLAVVDLTMPRMDGIETIEALLSIDPQMKAVLSSGYHREEIRQQFDQAKQYSFLQKPFFSQDLIKVVNEALLESQ